MPEAEIDQGTLINNRYRIERVIGQGGFGRTYLASDEQRFDELCVLKEFVPSTRAEYTVQKSRALFETEAKVLYQINHPQIPKFLACFAQIGRLFIVQEYIDGKTYSELLRERQQLRQLFSEAEVIQWLRDLLPVLTYLHERNIVHRDISPDNVMLPNYQSRPVLIDFGLVKQTVTQIWAVHSDIFSGLGKSFVGKYGYAPLEQIRMGQCYPCSDLYALGVTVVVLLTGKDPNFLMDQGSLEWQWHDYAKVSDDLTQILDKMLAEKPKNRYQSAQEVLADLPLHTSPEVIAVPTPLMELQIEIDHGRKDRQVAEIAEMDYFQQLQRQAESLRNSIETDAAPQLEAEPQVSKLLDETAGSWSTGAVNTEIQPEPTTPPRPPEPPVLKLIHSSGREFRLQGEECYIGRQGQSSMNLQKIDLTGISKIDLTGIANEGVVSRTHARIYWDWSQNTYMLVDNNSRNGTCLNGTPLLPGVHYRLSHGDSLQLGQTNLVCFTVSVTWFEAKPQLSTLLDETAVSLPSRVVNPDIQPQAATEPKLNPAFIDRCRQELSHHIGPIARYILEETLAEHPNLSAPQLVEALAAEIPNPQQAVEFRQRLLL